jgi:Trypsin-like peptidase domain/Colicin V production protein
MTVLDWIIVAFTVLMALWGYSQGLLVGALSLAGFLAGAFLGSRVGPLVLEEGSRSPYAPLFALGSAFLVGGVLSTGLEMLGFRLRRRLGPTLGLIDGLGGAVLLACAGLVLWWIAGAVALQTPGARELRGEIQRSKVLGALNDTLPPSGPLLNALARFDPFPEITGPDADVPAPDAAILRDPDVRAAGDSVVRVLGTACGLGVGGSGWVAGDGIVVTNAHVVAGQDDTTVQIRGEGPRLDAEAVWFDPHNDVALLSVPATEGVPALELDVDEEPGTAAAVLGFPENGPFDAQPGRLGRTQTIRTEDAYGRGPVERRVTTLRGLVRPGNSGGPLVDPQGQVVATIFAATRGSGNRSGLGVPDSVVQDALSRASGGVDTGPCAR